ncbi:hypothetical protein [Halalkalibacter alkaliphilus]|uniref:Uncharacterized protein n=1 Tax=Halalkalibacter alkaliphilus TaxID=2917993 RepID=A0A9X2CX59_9BACI|nr:hypothetical protein [Halalkalibacter alkaliphilus]MCL7749429.1 hypothetical protein [Halalkalibacter alkaliphilus]
MELLIAILLFTGLFAIYDAIRKVNNNILKQTEEIIKLREEMTKHNRK